MKIIEKISFMAIIMSFFGNVASADLLGDVKTKGVLTVGTEMQYAPFDFLENNKQVGFNADLFKEIGKELSVTISFADLPWPSVLPGLSASKFDIVAGPLSITAERAEKYRFTSPINKGAYSLVRRTNDNSIKSYEDLKGKVLGGMRGDVSLERVKELAKKYGAKEVREYGSSSQAYADLAAGRIVAVANVTANNGYTSALRPSVFSIIPGTFGEVKYEAYAARNDSNSEALIVEVNRAIKLIKEDGRLATIQKKWLGEAISLPDSVDASKY